VADVAADVSGLESSGESTVLGTVGAVVSGTLYLDDVATSLAPDADTTASEVSALPYSYTIGSAR